MTAKSERERIAAIIRALRAKTVENGCTEGEALAAAAKVAELLAEYNMSADEAELRASPFDGQTHSVPDDDVGTRLWKPATAIAELVGARYWTTAPGVHPVEHTYFGFDHEVEIAGYLLEICERAMRSAEARMQRSLALFRPARRRMQIIPFLDGMADRLRERILAMKPPVPAGTGLVLVRKDLIDAAMKARGINLRTTAGRSSRSDEETYRQGRRAAEDVALNPGLRTAQDARRLGGRA
jgi:hypothetical protein